MKNINLNNLFDEIYKEVIVPLTQDLSKSFDEIQLINRAEKKKYTLKKHFEKEYMIFMKSYMYENATNLDRHKIAACMMKSILIVKPIKIPVRLTTLTILGNLNLPKKVFLVNQYLALSVAITIMDGYINSDKNKKLKHKVFFPETFYDNSEKYVYEQDVCLDLYYTKPSSINTISYANIFFLLEKYSCRKIQSKRLEDECKKLIKKYTKFNSHEVDKMIENIKFGEDDT